MERLDRAESALQRHASRVTRHPTPAPRTANLLARDCLATGSDLIVAAGGDGTVNEVAGGMVGSHVPLGVLPAGTANVLAHEIGLGSNMDYAARNMFRFVPRQVSMGRIDFADQTSQHFLLMAGAGLDAHIVFNLNLAMKARFGKMAYWIGGFGQFGRRLEEFEVEANGQRHRCSFALISKVRNYGGDFEIARQVRIIDPNFEVVLFAGHNSYRYLLYLGGVAANQLKRVKGVTVYRAKKISLCPRNGDSVHLQVDGEYAGLLPATITAVPDSLTLLFPARYLTEC